MWYWLASERAMGMAVGVVVDCVVVAAVVMGAAFDVAAGGGLLRGPL